MKLSKRKIISRNIALKTKQNKTYGKKKHTRGFLVLRQSVLRWCKIGISLPPFSFCTKMVSSSFSSQKVRITLLFCAPIIVLLVLAGTVFFPPSSPSPPFSPSPSTDERATKVAADDGHGSNKIEKVVFTLRELHDGGNDMDRTKSTWPGKIEKEKTKTDLGVSSKELQEEAATGQSGGTDANHRDGVATAPSRELPMPREELLAFIKSKGVFSNIDPCVWERFELDYVAQHKHLKKEAEEELKLRSSAGREESGALSSHVLQLTVEDTIPTKSTRAYTFYPPTPITRKEMLMPLPGDTRSSSSPSSSLSPHLLPAQVPVYMVHYTPMVTRRVNLTKMLEKHDIYPEWVLGFDKEALGPEDGKCFFTFNSADFAAGGGGSVLLDHYVLLADDQGRNKNNNSNRTSERGLNKETRATFATKPVSELVPDESDRKENRHNKAKNPHRGGPAPLLKGGQRSVVTKHHSALYRVLRNEDEAAVILEDDAFLRNGFKQRLGQVLAEVIKHDPHYDVLWIGGCMKMRGWRRKFNTEYVSPHLYKKREARCAHAYLVSNAGAAKLLNGAPFTLPIDFQYSAAMREGAVRSYWVEPWLSIQGDMGACVTNSDLGAGCVSVERGYDPAFDLKKMGEVDQGWDRIPSFRSKR